MAKMKKWMLIKPHENASIQIWEFIDDIEEAMEYWYVRDAIEKFGVDSMMPIVMNDMGGYHTHRPDEKDVVAIIESYKKPNISVFKQYPINNAMFHTGWVSPDCTTFSCGYMEHIGLAMKIVEELFAIPEHVVADDFLLDLGWIKVMHGKYLFHYGKINNKQAVFLQEKGFTK